MASTPASTRWADVFVVHELDPLVNFADSRTTPCVINSTPLQSSLDRTRSADSPRKKQNSQATDGATDVSASFIIEMAYNIKGYSVGVC